MSSLSTSQREFMMRQLKKQLITQIDAALASNPNATFEDFLKTIVEAMTKEAKKNPTAIPLQSLSEVIQHYHQKMTIQGSIQE